MKRSLPLSKEFIAVRRYEEQDVCQPKIATTSIMNYLLSMKGSILTLQENGRNRLDVRS